MERTPEGTYSAARRVEAQYFHSMRMTRASIAHQEATFGFVIPGQYQDLKRLETLQRQLVTLELTLLGEVAIRNEGINMYSLIQAAHEWGLRSEGPEAQAQPDTYDLHLYVALRVIEDRLNEDAQTLQPIEKPLEKGIEASQHFQKDSKLFNTEPLTLREEITIFRKDFEKQLPPEVREKAERAL